MPAQEAPPKAPAPAAEPSELSRVQKLAALLVILGPDAAAQILRGFESHEVETISSEMANFAMISQELQSEILQEFSEVAIQAGTAIRGGVDVTRATLEKAMGLYKATEILSRVAPSPSPVAAIGDLAEMEPRQFYNLLRHEQPQTVALVVSYVGPQRAAEALMFFAAEQRDKILERIATLAPTPVEVIEKVVEILLARRGTNQTRALNQSGGVKTAADVLNAMEKTQGKTLLGSLEERNPELGQAIRQKMFTFEDLASLDSATLQRILREVDLRELALALRRNASEKLKSTLLGCITKRAAETVQEEMVFMGPVRLRDIESAQLRIIDAVRRLEAEGTVDLSEVHGRGRNEMC
ncbi:Flagellar motor switch protein FliG [Verrucomicrobia bacterium]|nr:Flagellar motor switch protein FliG [Verrucomicrobiota bacterium]